jgi:hypothetical protein
MADGEAWALKAWCVYGGYQIRLARWVYVNSGGVSGWDQEDEVVEGETAVYPTQAECEARIAQLRREEAA